MSQLLFSPTNYTAMYLKRLHLQGFKTFANKTEFLFDQGITAVVGPNGSGKSNIADAVRWVLGEQKYSTLRGRKTEDLIFAGSSRRAAQGFAEASITFDNADGKLPVNFSEVTITRRAYRTGENEYYLNKSRVRLKDIAEVTAPLAQTYTIITQGMVDAALSLKPDERRGLFEDAAAIGLYNQKKADAQNRLTKQEDNSRQVELMLGEIEPRLKSLERHARQAEEFYSLREELQTLLKRYYSDRWRKALSQLDQARQQEQLALHQFDAARQHVATAQTDLESSRIAIEQQRSQIAHHHRAISEQHEVAQKLERQLGIAHEKMNGLLRQRENFNTEDASLELNRANILSRITQHEKDLARLLQTQTRQSRALSQQEQLLLAATTATQQADKEVQQTHLNISRLTSQIDNLKQRTALLEQQKIQIEQQQERHLQLHADLLARLQHAEEEADVAQGLLSGFGEKVRQLQEQQRHTENEHVRLAETTAGLERNLQEKRSQREAAKSRLELFQRLQSSFAGLHGGVKAVMQFSAATKPQLPGILGLVGSLLQSPPELETAIEVALGGHLQDIVVDTFDSAERAIDYLKQSGSGRATFLPLDNLRQSPNQVLSRKVAALEGVRGVAEQLIECEAQFRPVYQQLLSRTIVVDTLATGRTVLREAGAGWTAVTLNGEILRSSGAVTGGATGKDKDRAEGSFLLRERELRELPAEITRLEVAVQQLNTQIKDSQAQILTARQNMLQLERELSGVNRQQQQAQENLLALRSNRERLQSELNLRAESRQASQGELGEIIQRLTELAANQHRLLAELKIEESTLSRHETQRKTAESASTAQREKLVTLRTEMALLNQKESSLKENLLYLQNELRTLESSLQSRQARHQQITLEIAGLEEDIKLAGGHFAAVDEALENARLSLTPVETELKTLEKRQATCDKSWNAASAELMRLETAYNRQQLQVRLLETELENVRQRASEELAPSLTDTGELDQTANLLTEVDPEQWAELLELTPTEGVQAAERIEQLKGRLRRIGSVNPLALQEYRETAQRFNFLSSQVKDLEQSTRTLRALIKELDELTRARFGATFARVADEFSRFFSLLFNGGTAKLTLTDPENLDETGIEILAQPPGKRPQSLALLSGGERSLTATALIFALLEVNPSPFCILDEVDAALDEANVGRFCEVLRTLSLRTQFIVITHNRGTIEAARTIYGVSMGADNVSQVMSLRLEQVPGLIASEPVTARQSSFLS